MFDPAAEPRWMRRCAALALRLGFVPSLVGLSLLLVLGVLALTQAGLWFSGQGSKPVALLVAGAMAMLLSPFVAAWLLRLMFQLHAARQRHNVDVAQDEASGAHGRRHFMQVAEREWARCRRYAEDGTVLVIEADQFRSLQARHGPACCDALLRDLMRLVTQSLRQPDLLARFGAEVLIVYLPNTDPMGALDAAERLRERIAGHTLRWQHSGVSSTVSIGVASAGAAHLSLEALVQDALTALQAAKDAGHNCVRAAPIQPRATPAQPPSAASGGPRARRP